MTQLENYNVTGYDGSRVQGISFTIDCLEGQFFTDSLDIQVGYTNQVAIDHSVECVEDNGQTVWKWHGDSSLTGPKECIGNKEQQFLWSKMCVRKLFSAYCTYNVPLLVDNGKLPTFMNADYSNTPGQKVTYECNIGYEFTEFLTLG